MPETCYRTGQAAKLLGRSSYEIRRLAESGLIDAEYNGKQWRIPAAEVERLRKDGVPEIPSSSEMIGNGAARPASNKSGPNGLLAPPSEDLIDSTEDLIATENLLKKRNGTTGSSAFVVQENAQGRGGAGVNEADPLIPDCGWKLMPLMRVFG